MKTDMDVNNTVLRPVNSWMEEKNPREVKPLVLAFIGDSVYEVYVRNHVLSSLSGNVNELHKRTVKYVKAISQAFAVKEMMRLELLSDEEISIFKRGRNQFNQTLPKSASVVEYKVATGFESLIGYLYLDKKYDRLDEIARMAIEIISKID